LSYKPRINCLTTHLFLTACTVTPNILAIELYPLPSTNLCSSSSDGQDAFSEALYQQIRLQYL